jgi:hypothetical protein
MSYKVQRTEMWIGRWNFKDQFYVQYITAHEEEAVASFWIGPRMPEAEAERRANALAHKLNVKSCRKKVRKP